MSKKVEDAKKRCARLNGELEKAQETIKDAQKRHKAKEAELNKANMDLINLMLVENELTMQDLPDLISELATTSGKKEKQDDPTSTNDAYMN